MGNVEKERYEALETVVEGAVEKTGKFLKGAFKDMAENAKAQHEIDKANFEAVKAQSKANFEANRFHNSLERAKEINREVRESIKNNK